MRRISLIGNNKKIPNSACANRRFRQQRHNIFVFEFSLRLNKYERRLDYLERNLDRCLSDEIK